MRYLLACAANVLLALASGVPSAGATALIGGFSPSAAMGPLVTFQPPSNGTLSGLTVTAIAMEQSSATLVDGNSTAFVDLRGLDQGGVNADGSFAISLGLVIRASAMATGHAVAQARQIYDVSVRNTSAQTQQIRVRAHYSISERVAVDNLMLESALAFWDIGVVFDDFELKQFGELGRTIDCSNPLQNVNACPNFYDGNSSDYYELALAPGESLDFEMRTVARFEVTAVPEPSTLALFGLGGLVAFATRRREAAVRA